MSEREYRDLAPLFKELRAKLFVINIGEQVLQALLGYEDESFSDTIAKVLAKQQAACQEAKDVVQRISALTGPGEHELRAQEFLREHLPND